jgi:hypothetical protein
MPEIIAYSESFRPTPAKTRRSGAEMSWHEGGFEHKMNTAEGFPRLPQC